MWCKNTGTKQCIAGLCPDGGSCRITCNQMSRLRSRQSVKEEKQVKVQKIEQTSNAPASNVQASNAQASDAQASNAQASEVRNIKRKIEQIAACTRCRRGRGQEPKS